MGWAVLGGGLGYHARTIEIVFGGLKPKCLAWRRPRDQQNKANFWRKLGLFRRRLVGLRGGPSLFGALYLEVLYSELFMIKVLKLQFQSKGPPKPALPPAMCSERTPNCAAPVGQHMHIVRHTCTRSFLVLFMEFFFKLYLFLILFEFICYFFLNTINCRVVRRATATREDSPTPSQWARPWPLQAQALLGPTNSSRSHTHAAL